MIYTFFIIYQISHIIILPFFTCYLILRKIKGKSAFGSLKERLGFVPKAPKNKNIVWLHAVSVGEVLSLQSIVEKIKQDTNTFVYLTVGTTTGKTMATKKLNADAISFLPYDFLLPMLLAFRRIKPNKIIIVEAELWPNFLMLARMKQIPLFLINARVSERSGDKYRLFKAFLAPLLNFFEKIYTQSEEDTKAFAALGVKKEKLETLGNIKAANVLKKKKEVEKEKARSNFTLLAGSIHPGEEEIYLELYAKLKSKFPELKLILAPRHFHWKNELVKKTKKTGYSYEIWDEKNRPKGDRDILLVCKLGELFSLYQQTTIYFLGGTFVPIGGHNLLEPAAWETPTIIGPHHQNCKVTAENLLKENGVIIVKDLEELENQTEFLLSHSFERNQIGHNARAWLEHEGERIEKKVISF